jgi:hypothetical protein
VYIRVCARFNIDVIKSQLDLIQQASPYQNRLVSFSFSLSLVLFSGSSTNIFFSPTHSLASRWSSLNNIHYNKRESRVQSFFIFFSSSIRTTNHHSLLIKKLIKKKKKKKVVSFSPSL